MAFKLLPIIIGILVTIILVVGNYDLRLQQAIYRAGENSWALGEHPFWQLLYHAGPYPVIAIGVSALIALSLSWSMERFGKWRRVYIYISLLLFLGPAVIVNFGLKDNWGRPRPIHVDSMGGKQPFENVFVLNESREGKSFPCGHASTGFVLMAGYFVFCRHRRRLAYGWLIAGAVFGTLLGIARMLQGGHFLTDVIWVALICYYLALWLYYLLGLKDSVSRTVKRRHRMPVKVRLLMLFVAIVSVAGILLATPYRDDRKLALAAQWERDVPIKLRATLSLGRVEMVPADSLLVRKKSTGHGVPTSRVAARLFDSGNGELVTAHYVERQSGWFHELATETQMELPWYRIQSLQIDGHSAEVLIKPGVLNHKMPIQILSGEGEITIHTGGNAIVWSGGDRSILKGAELLAGDAGVEKGLILTVGDAFTGHIHLIK